MVTLFTFGCGARGELGLPRADERCRPEANAVAFPRAQQNAAVDFQITAIALGSDHSLAVVGGSVFRWGLLVSNALPHWQTATTGAGEVVPQPAPLASWSNRVHRNGESVQDITQFAALSGNVQSVACGGSTSFILTNEGEVFFFGDLRPPGGDAGCIRSLWGSPKARIVQIAAGWRHCLLLTDSGEIHAFGDDEYGQCAGAGNGDARLALPTSLGLVGIAAGACHSLAWDASGSAFAWGHGGSGRLGLGSSEHCRAPRQIVTLLEPVFLASCGANFSLFATQHGRALWACGGNQYGQLGLGGSNRAAQEVPVQLDLPRRNEEIVSLECGVHHALCLTSVPEAPGRAFERRVAWAWGCASSGQCGLAPGERRGEGPPQSRSAPEPLVDFLAPSPHWPIAVAAGRSHSAVLAQTRHHLATGFEPAPIPGAPPIPGSATLRSTAALFPVATNSNDLRTTSAASVDAPVEPMTSRSATPWAVPPEVPPPPPWFPPRPLHANSPNLSLQHSQSAPHLAKVPLATDHKLRNQASATEPPDAFGDDIIDTFCASLSVPQAQRRLNFHSFMCSPPPSAVPQPCLRSAASPRRSPERFRSLSPVAALVELGEAVLRGDDIESVDDFSTQNRSFQRSARHEASRAVGANESRSRDGKWQKGLHKRSSDTRSAPNHCSTARTASQAQRPRMVMSGVRGRSAVLEAERIVSGSFASEDRRLPHRGWAHESTSFLRNERSSRRNSPRSAQLHRSSSDSRLQRTSDPLVASRRDAFGGNNRYHSRGTRQAYDRPDAHIWDEGSMSDDPFGNFTDRESSNPDMFGFQHASASRSVKKTKEQSPSREPTYQPHAPFRQDGSFEFASTSYSKRGSWEFFQTDYGARSSAEQWRGVHESVNDLTSMIAGMTGSLSPRSRFGGGLGYGFNFGLGGGLSSPFIASNGIGSELHCNHHSHGKESPFTLQEGPLILTGTATGYPQGTGGSTPQSAKDNAPPNIPTNGKRLSVSSQRSRISMRRSSHQKNKETIKKTESEELEQNYTVTQPCPPTHAMQTETTHVVRTETLVRETQACTVTHPSPPIVPTTPTETPMQERHAIEPEPLELGGGRQNLRESSMRLEAHVVELAPTIQRSISKASTTSSTSCKFAPRPSAFTMEETSSTPRDNVSVSQHSPTNNSPQDHNNWSNGGGSQNVSHGGSPFDTRGSSTIGSYENQPSSSKPSTTIPTPRNDSQGPKQPSPSVSSIQEAEKQATQDFVHYSSHEPLLLGGNEDETSSHPDGRWNSPPYSVGAAHHAHALGKNASVNGVAPAVDLLHTHPPSNSPVIGTTQTQEEETVLPFSSGSSSDGQNDRVVHVASNRDGESDSGGSSARFKPASAAVNGKIQERRSQMSNGSSSGSDSGDDSSSSSSERGVSVQANQEPVTTVGRLSSGGSSGSSSGGHRRIAVTNVGRRQLSSDEGESSASNSPPKATGITSRPRMTSDTIVESVSGGFSGSDSDLAYTRTASRDVDLPKMVQPISSPRTPPTTTPAPTISAPPPKPTPACEEDMGIESMSD